MFIDQRRFETDGEGNFVEIRITRCNACDGKGWFWCDYASHPSERHTCGRCSGAGTVERRAIVATRAEVAFEERLEALYAERRACIPGTAEWRAADDAIYAHNRYAV